MSEQIPTETKPFAKAPIVTSSVYEETMPLLFASDLAYRFTDVLIKAEKKKLVLEIPDEFRDMNLGRFLSDSADLTEFNHGNGLCFHDMSTIIERNNEVLQKAFAKLELVQLVVQSFRDQLAAHGNQKYFFLTFHRSIQKKVACVYSVIKDTLNKKIIVAFRGSQFRSRDWPINLKASPVALRTPKKIQHKMEGILKERVLVHRGFRQYLFSNKRMDGDQRYDMIIKDIEKAIGGEEGYNVYITGHSLGGALATMLSFKLAGAGEKCHNIPRPITCITFCAPFSGTRGYRTAFEHMEREGLLRSLRLNNAEDIVPAVPPISLLRKRCMKHVGINLRLSKSDYRLEHSSRANISTAFRNCVIKPICCFLTWHKMLTIKCRLENNKAALEAVTLDELYKNETIVSKSFIEG